MHRVTVDRVQAIVSMTAGGFFGEADLLAAAADLHVAIRSLGDRAGRHVTLYDLTALKVVPPPIIDQFARYFTDSYMQPLWARRVALVSGSALVSLQMDRVRRVAETIRVFDNRREAVAWLLADRERLRAA